MRCRLSPVTPVSVDRTTLFYGTHVPERDPMDLMRVSVEAISILLMVIVVVALVAMTVAAAKAAKSGSHGCGPVESEDDKAEKQRQLMVEYHLSLWEQGTCKHCRKQREIYAPDELCSECMWSDQFGPSY